jgi:L,D-peptidoglycan transpeptidase YkuD (ErfK/YbiS/YcfS/YnhG family)
MKRMFTLGAVALFLAVLPCMALAQGNATKEASTAHTHATLAAKADSIKMTHMHLHHVVNCLVGKNGKDFDAKAGNPCKGMGSGALKDSSNNESLHDKLEKALTSAQAGIDDNNLQSAHKHAHDVAKKLSSAMH